MPFHTTTTTETSLFILLQEQSVEKVMDSLSLYLHLIPHYHQYVLLMMSVKAFGQNDSDASEKSNFTHVHA